MRIKPKMILVISAVVVLSVVPLSAVVLWRNQAVLIEKTYEVCRNLGNSIANLATEELLVDETYDATGTAMIQLRKSEISGLRDSFVVNLDGRIVADLADKRSGQKVDASLLKELMSLESLRMSEGQTSGTPELRFSYPIFITPFNGSRMRVGTAVFVFDRSMIFEPVRTLRNSIIAVCLVLLVGGLVVGLFTAIYFSRPIQVLSDGARIIGSGDLSHRIDIHNRDELGDLARSFNRMTEQIQDFTQNLEQKVKERTEELNLALEEVTALKMQQDGDYFLTSLLMEPLGRNANHSPFASTNYTMRQKKHFRFKHWESEIGGDICITDSVPIGGKTYTIFINADAMGKSIQGAGGALVLGAVFQAILVRSRVGRHQSKSPEIWLRDAFLDLQNIFVSFNGSMYVSMVIGLLGADGILYFVNAEHPWLVLYRKGQASFLRESQALRKLGVPGEEDKFRVQMVNLETDDVVIAGSDGRDDLIIARPGGETMNEDETEFLHRVEESGGRVDALIEKLEGFGRITDDLSLMSITYTGVKPTDEAVPPDIQESMHKGLRLEEEGKIEEALQAVESVLGQGRLPDLMEWSGRLYFRQGDYEKSLECFLAYLDLRPGDDEALHVTANLFRLLGRLNDAADFGERLYLRDPNHELNLLNLAAIYDAMGQAARAEKLALKCLDLNGDMEEAKRLLKRMKENVPVQEEEHVSAEQLERMKREGDESYQAHNFFKASRIYREILDLEPDDEWALFRLGNCWLKLNRPEDARTYYNRTLVVNPSNHHARNNLGVLYHGMGLVERAREQLEKALAAQTDFAPAKMNQKRLEKGRAMRAA